MRRRAWPFLFLAAALMAAPAADAAKRPPRASLHANQQSARLAPYTWGWTGPQGDGCFSVNSDGVPDFSPRLALEHRHAKPRIVLHRDRRPRVHGFRSHRSLNEHGSVAGQGKKVRSRVRPRRRNGEIAGWAVIFRVDVVERPYFRLDLGFPLRREGGCPEGGQGHYAFGLTRE